MGGKDTDKQSEQHDVIFGDSYNIPAILKSHGVEVASDTKDYWDSNYNRSILERLFKDIDFPPLSNFGAYVQLLAAENEVATAVKAKVRYLSKRHPDGINDADKTKIKQRQTFLRDIQHVKNAIGLEIFGDKEVEKSYLSTITNAVFNMPSHSRHLEALRTEARKNLAQDIRSNFPLTSTRVHV